MPMKIDLGCGPTPKPGYVGVDLLTGPNIKTMDLNKFPWDIPSNSIDEVRAYDILEHLPDKNAVMAEIERILAPGGILDILVPSTDGRGAWQDPTHCSYWNENSFAYYTKQYPGYLELNQRYGYKGLGFEVVVAPVTYALPGSLPHVLHVAVKLRKPG